MLLEFKNGEAILYRSYATDELLKAVPAAQAAGIWKQLEAQIGTGSEDVLESSKKNLGQNVQFIQALKFGSTTLAFITVFNAESKLMGIAFQPYQLKEGTTKPTDRAPYDNPENYTEEEIHFQSGSYKINGTLTRPKSGFSGALVVFVTGSGPNDRHSTVGPNRPHQDMAGGLARMGIASLRFDKRTFSAAQQLQAEGIPITIDNEVVDDAVEAISFAKKLDGVDAQKLYLLGHSLGGMLAPRIAARADLTGIIILAGNARPLEDLILEQFDKLLANSPDKEASIRQLKIQIANLEKLDKGFDVSASELPLGQPASYWRSLRAYDQVATARQLRVPIMILQGEADYQVTMEDFELWKEALPKAKAISYAGLNHLMLPSNGKVGTEAYSEKGYVSEQLIADIANWINKK